VLLDIERIAPCMPGAALDSVDGDDFTGRVKVKLGPINLTYQGKASFIEKDEAAHKAVIDARGKDQRGNGTAAATITANLAAEGSITRVHVVTDLNITGRPAQFGRGVMTDVGNKLLGQFADKLAAQLGEGDAQGDADRASAAGVTGAAGKAAAAVTGAVEEVAASAEQVPGEGPAAGAVKKAAAATKKAAASATDTVELPTKAARNGTKSTPAKATPEKPEKAAPAKAAPAKATPASAAAEKSASAPGEATPPPTSPAGVSVVPPLGAGPVKAPSGPPNGRSGPPSRPGTGSPVRSVPSAGPTRPRVVAEPEPIDLLEVAGGAALARYAAPAAGIAAAVLLVVLVVRRRRR
jgi:carbon monoxide dehydrogenase subunit G